MLTRSFTALGLCLTILLAAGLLLLPGSSATAQPPVFKARAGGFQHVGFRAENPAGGQVTAGQVPFTTATIDTGNGFDPVTSRYTAPLPGVYRVAIHAYVSNFTPPNFVVAEIHKNGASSSKSQYFNTVGAQSISVETLVTMNGTTDYLEFFAFPLNANGLLVLDPTLTFATASRVSEL